MGSYSKIACNTRSKFGPVLVHYVYQNNHAEMMILIVVANLKQCYPVTVRCHTVYLCKLIQIKHNTLKHMGQVMELWLSCYLVLLSIDSKTRQQDSRSSVTWPIWSAVCRREYVLEIKIFDETYELVGFKFPFIIGILRNICYHSRYGIHGSYWNEIWIHLQNLEIYFFHEAHKASRAKLFIPKKVITILKTKFEKHFYWGN